MKQRAWSCVAIVVLGVTAAGQEGVVTRPEPEWRIDVNKTLEGYETCKRQLAALIPAITKAAQQVRGANAKWRSEATDESWGAMMRAAVDAIGTLKAQVQEFDQQQEVLLLDMSRAIEQTREDRSQSDKWVEQLRKDLARHTKKRDVTDAEAASLKAKLLAAVDKRGPALDEAEEKRLQELYESYLEADLEVRDHEGQLANAELEQSDAITQASQLHASRCALVGLRLESRGFAKGLDRMADRIRIYLKRKEVTRVGERVEELNELLQPFKREWGVFTDSMAGVAKDADKSTARQQGQAGAAPRARWTPSLVDWARGAQAEASPPTRPEVEQR